MSDNLQKTIAKSVSCSGIGVHSGKNVTIRVNPAPDNYGIKFIRTDLPNQPAIAARFNKVVDTSQATVIGSEGMIISTTEHLMAAISGLGIDNAEVEVDAYELPVMDGSAGPFFRMLKSAGIKTQSKQRCFFQINEPIELDTEGKFVGIYPAPHYQITCTIEFDHDLIRTQTFSIVITPESFEAEIADARTFGFWYEEEYMRRYGLAQGTSLENTVIIDRDNVRNKEGLRFPDEFVRHKLLDCIGDFSLLGLPIKGHVITRRSGHSFNHKFLQTFFANKNAWQTCTAEDAPTI